MRLIPPAFVAVLCLSLLFPGLAVTGNSGLIEQRINELNRLNISLVRDSITLPTAGTFYLKAHVYTRQESVLFNIISKNFSETREGIFPFTSSNESARK